MSTFIVTYDLYKSGQNYECLTKKLNAYPTHWKVQLSVWIIETEASAAQIRDNLAPCLDANDKLIVARLSGEAAWQGYAQNITDWLLARLQKLVK